MKRYLAIILAIAMIFTFAACSPETTDEITTETSQTEAIQKVQMNIATLKGPSGMGISKLISDVNSGVDTANDYSFDIMSSPDEVVSAISSGACDMASLPLNLASVLYQKTSGDIEMLTVGTLGVLYILEKGNTINSIADLKGKTVYSSGQGASPEYILNYILEANGLTAGEDVTVEYLSHHTELAVKVAAGDADICVLPEPFVTTVMSKNADLRIALDLTDEWNKACKVNGTESQLAMGCLVVNKDYAAENKEAINLFIDEYAQSVEFVNANQSQAAEIIASLEIVGSAELAENAIPNCNIVCMYGDEMKTIAMQNLQVLYDANPQSVGGEMPGEDFWYTK